MEPRRREVPSDGRARPSRGEYAADAAPSGADRGPALGERGLTIFTKRVHFGDGARVRMETYAFHARNYVVLWICAFTKLIKYTVEVEESASLGE